MNYSELQSLIADYIDQDEADTRATTFIRLCERNVNKRLRSEGTESLWTFSGDDIHSIYELPEYMGSIRFVHVAGVPIEFMTPDQLAQANLNRNSLSAYTRLRKNIRFNSILASTVSVEVDFHLMVPELSDSNTENWLLDDWEDVYINGSVYEATMFHKDYKAAELWKTRFEESLQDLINMDLDDRWSGSANQIRGA